MLLVQRRFAQGDAEQYQRSFDMVPALSFATIAANSAAGTTGGRMLL
jgi:hypothetical protein